MKIPKQISLRTTSIMVLIGIIITSGIFYVFAATPSSTFYISSGVYPGAPSYTVWKEGSNYFAKDANGQIKYSGTNATEVTQAVIDALPNPTGQSYSGMLCFASGMFTIGQLNITGKRVMIEGAGRWATDFSWGANGELSFIYADGTPTTADFQLRHCTIRTSPSVAWHAKVINLLNCNTVEIEDVSFYGHPNRDLTFLYLSNCYNGHLSHLRISTVNYGIYGDGVLNGDIHQTPNCWNLDGITIVDIDTGGTALYLERCIMWTINNMLLETASGSYGVFLNASAYITFSELDIVDAPFPTVGVYMTGWSVKPTSSIIFLNSFFPANDYCIQVHNYSGNVTFIQPHFTGATTALNFTGTTGVVNFVLINAFNECANFIIGKSYTTWLNGTYIAIP